MTRLSANMLLLVTAALWGAGNVAQKTVLDDLGPFSVLGFRCLIGLVVIAPLLLREVRTVAAPSPRGWCAIALAAAAFCVALCIQQIAYGLTSVTNASFIISATVVFTPLFAWLLMRERPRAATYPAVAAVLIGVRLMGEDLSGLNLGDAWCLVAAIVFSLWVVLVARVTRAYDRPFTIASCQFALASVFGLTIGLICEPFAPAALVGAAPELIMLGVLSTGAGFTLQVIAQRATSATEAAVITSAESLFGAVAAQAVLGEELTVAETLGATLILTGILLVQVPWALQRSRSRVA